VEAEEKSIVRLQKPKQLSNQVSMPTISHDHGRSYTHSNRSVGGGVLRVYTEAMSKESAGSFQPDIPFLNNVKYLGVIFDKKIMWRLHIEMVKTKAFRTFIRLHSLLKSERLITDIKLTLHKALIRSVMTYACLTWEFAADTHLMKLQCLKNRVLHTITRLCRQQARVENVCNIGQG
jgi:hypothetical protein